MLRYGNRREVWSVRPLVRWVRRLSWACLAGSVGWTLAAAPAIGKEAPAGKEPRARDVYYSAAGPVSISIALDEIGILVRDRVSAADLAAFADSAGLGVQQGKNTLISTFKLARQLNRRDLAVLARRLKRRGPGLIAEAGMAVRVRNSKTPVLVTDKFIVQFLPKTSQSRIDSMLRVTDVKVLEANVLKPGHYLLEVKEKSGRDAIAMSNHYQRSGLATYAHPNFIHAFRYRSEDPRFGAQWYHENTGQDADGAPDTEGTVDADLDTPAAWEMARAAAGGRTVTIAVIDGGYDLGHADLATSLWTNPRETAGDGIDNDCNGYPDDIHGWDFFACDGGAEQSFEDGCGKKHLKVCGDADAAWDPSDMSAIAYDPHGTPVAGLAAATVDNDTGIAGTCPMGKLMLLRRCSDEEHLAQAFQYAVENGASIISCSWGLDGTGTGSSTLIDAIDDAVLAGTVVLFAMDYATSERVCEREGTSDLAELPGVIAVGASTNWDRRLLETACGDYIDVLGPANRGYGEVDRSTGALKYGYSGSLSIATTDITGTPGYNVTDAFAISGCPDGTESDGTESDALDYTYCFGGTSAAAPIVAGVVGLVRAVEPGLSPAEVQRLLQDTADRIEPSVGAYDAATGFSRPSASLSTHGYGRVNAFEAVRVMAPASAGGKGGVDIFLRDNDLDWGNTEQPSNVTFERKRGFIPHWESPDIKVDAGPEYQEYPGIYTTPSLAFDALTDEKPVAGVENRVYVRVRNRGPKSAEDVTVRLFGSLMGAMAPPLPEEFWTEFKSGTFTPGDWTLIDSKALTGSLATSGSTAAREGRESTVIEEDKAQVCPYLEWTPSVASDGMPRNYTLLAIVDSPNDRPGPYGKSETEVVESDLVVDLLAASDNNVTLRNVHYEDTSATISADPAGDPADTPSSSGVKRFREFFCLRNPTKEIFYATYVTTTPSKWRIDRDDELPGYPIRILPGKCVRVRFDVFAPIGASGEINVFQYSMPTLDGSAEFVGPNGGLTLRFRPGD